MLLLKYLLTWGGIGMLLTAAAILAHDLYREFAYRRALTTVGLTPAPVASRSVRWRTAAAFALLAWAPILIALGIVVVPSGMAGVRVSQTSGTRAGSLYPGVHFVQPVSERVVLFDTRDQLFTTGSLEDSAKKLPVGKAEAPVQDDALRVQAKEGLNLGLAITCLLYTSPSPRD